MGRHSVEDPVPAYEDLYEQSPSNVRTGYSDLPVDDIENQEHHHNHPSSVPLIAQNGTQHVHCEVCDRREERRERRRSKERCCTTVAVVMLIIVLLIVLLLMAIFVSRRRVTRH
ncbi:hypothetical protein N7456_002213 [Penicillium angulare]|uniref:Uncharacterized protein n=1 Tax=Penicillium angulare TaxID=116970 RepID=A0A9W9G7N9_9EURO|nr:hypothetical protein N7456_002213 [Penicillium angulare]